MKYCNLFFIPFLILLFSCRDDQVKNIDLSGFEWSLTSDDSSIILKNVNPADVHLALLEAGLIPDPFYRDHEKELQWVSEYDWTFVTNFDLEDSFFNHEHIELVFEGLDTYAQVVLNDSLVLLADNMFRNWRIKVKDILNPGNNTLSICFSSPEKKNKARQEQLSYALPDIRGFTRKAAYQFGWDWGPTFVTSGIWKPAYLKAWDGAVIRDVYQRSFEVKGNEANVMLETEVEATTHKQYQIQVFVNDSVNSEYGVQFDQGINLSKIPVRILNPKLWWPNGYGEQHRYKLTVKLLDEDKLMDEVSFKTGLRKVELVQEVDSVGSSFYFKINGIPVFAKGANYIPQDNFLPRLKEENYENLILDAKKSNMNMLRVWGGGIYENDIFYKLCDKHGIMVWQDFMFACNLYPGDSQFVKNVKREATDNIRRIRNHPSLVIWCGNNEVDEAWHNWGWQKQFNYSPEDSVEIWNHYRDLFEDLLPGLVKKYNPEIPYWPSSPSTGWGRPEAYTSGDVHYWGVWWGKEPFEKYEEKVGRFMSEYGFQGIPDLKTIHAFTEPVDRHLGSKVMDVHQKHPFGWEAIQEYMERDYKAPESFEDYVYISQLLQAKGIKTAMEAHRRAKPHCMGTLYWQFNDCWPVTSWSGIDYYGRWKALQYAVKRAYKTYLISFEEKNEHLAIYVVSDSISDVNANLTWKLMDFNGNSLREGQKEISVLKNSSGIYAEVGCNQLAGRKSEFFLSVELWSQNTLLSTAEHYFVKPNQLTLPSADIQIQVLEKNKNYLIELTSETLAKDVSVSSTVDGHFSDKNFDLLPGQKKSLYFVPGPTNDQIPEFEIKCLNDIQ
ncbi:MAG: glycoside hydrolase family 2 protein [Bacteroidetes bacterium]|nr:glycoside hydrolase family 2 protein [Bacteroidota bacterium]